MNDFDRELLIAAEEGSEEVEERGNYTGRSLEVGLGFEVTGWLEELHR